MMRDQLTPEALAEVQKVEDAFMRHRTTTDRRWHYPLGLRHHKDKVKAVYELCGLGSPDWEVINAWWERRHQDQEPH